MSSAIHQLKDKNRVAKNFAITLTDLAKYRGYTRSKADSRPTASRKCAQSSIPPRQSSLPPLNPVFFRASNVYRVAASRHPTT
jgi:hypothetical protein